MQRSCVADLCTKPSATSPQLSSGASEPLPPRREGPGVKSTSEAKSALDPVDPWLLGTNTLARTLRFGLIAATCCASEAGKAASLGDLQETGSTEGPGRLDGAASGSDSPGPGMGVARSPIEDCSRLGWTTLPGTRPILGHSFKYGPYPYMPSHCILKHLRELSSHSYCARCSCTTVCMTAGCAIVGPPPRVMERPLLPGLYGSMQNKECCILQPPHVVHLHAMGEIFVRM